jgi:hypothetical protein
MSTNFWNAGLMGVVLRITEPRLRSVGGAFGPVAKEVVIGGAAGSVIPDGGLVV